MRTVSKNLYITVRDVESDSVIKMITTDTGDVIIELANKATFRIDLIQESLNEMKEFLNSRNEMDKIEAAVGPEGMMDLGVITDELPF